MKGKNNRKAKISRAFYKKHKAEIVNSFLELAARELKEVEEKLIRKVIETGFPQNKKIVGGFIEIKVRLARNGGVIVNRKLDQKAFIKAILQASSIKE